MIEKFDVRDRRSSNWFWCPNIFLKAKVNHTIKLVYFALCSYANKNTESCYPGMRAIAEIASISKRSVVTAIKLLEEAGIISYKKGTGRKNTNTYILLSINGAKVAHLEKVQLEAHKRCNSRQIKGELGETKQTKGTNEINNRGLNLLREKMKEIHIKAFPN